MKPYSFLALLATPVMIAGSGLRAEGGEAPRRELTEVVSNCDSKKIFDDITYTVGRATLPLDWCYKFRSFCDGATAANAYCTYKGFQGGATKYTKKKLPSGHTVKIGDQSICDTRLKTCHTFGEITCSRGQRQYDNPKEIDLPIDWCYKFEQSCGKPAAEAFCKKKGCNTVKEYPSRKIIQGRTLTIGDHAVCDTKYHGCDSFRHITCAA